MSCVSKDKDKKMLGAANELAIMLKDIGKNNLNSDYGSELYGGFHSSNHNTSEILIDENLHAGSVQGFGDLNNLGMLQLPRVNRAVGNTPMVSFASVYEDVAKDSCDNSTEELVVKDSLRACDDFDLPASLVLGSELQLRKVMVDGRLVNLGELSLSKPEKTDTSFVDSKPSSHRFK